MQSREFDIDLSSKHALLHLSIMPSAAKHDRFLKGYFLLI